MKDTDIARELETLRLRILMEGVEKTPTDLERYRQWCDEIQGRGRWEGFRREVFYPEEYAECKFLVNLVTNLYEQAHADDRDFHKNKRDIRRIINEIIFMARFVQKDVKKHCGL